MDPWDHINPYASSSSSRYGNPVSNFETPNKANANQTSRCIWGQADKSSPRTHNHRLSNAFQEGELSCSRSAQGQWEKINKYVGGISCASTKNITLYTRRERPRSYTARCQWKNEEVPPSDTYGKEESSYGSPWNNKNDCNSRNNVAAERASGLPTESRLECRRSLFDLDYEAENEFQTRDYHSGRDHNNVAESKLKGGSNCDGLDYVGGIKSDYDNLPEIRLQERDHHDLKKCDYYSDKSDDDIDRLGKDYSSSSEENYLVDIELANRNDQFKKKHDCGRETQLRRRDDSPYKSHDLVVVKTELEESQESNDLVVVKTEVEERPDFEETFDYIAETGLRKRDLSPEWEHVVEPHPKKQNVESDKMHKHPKQRDYHFDWSLLLGERDDYSDSHLRNCDRHLEETDYTSHGYPNKTQLEMKDIADNNKQPEKGEGSVSMRKALVSLVSGGAALSTLSIPQASEIQKPLGQPSQKGKNTKRKRRLRPFIMKLPSGKKLQMSKSDAITLGLMGQKREDVTRATGDKQSEDLHDKSNGNKNDRLEKREEESYTTDNNVTKSHLEKKDNHQDKSYHDKNNMNIWSFLEQLEKIKEGSHTTESRWDKKHNQTKSYHDNNNINIWSFLEELEKIKEVSDDSATKSHWDKKDDHQDKNYHDKNNRHKNQLEKEEVSHTADNYVTNSHWDKKDNHQNKKYQDKNNRNKKDQVEKEEISHTADVCVTKSHRDKKDNRQDKNYRDKNNRNKNELEKREKVSHTADDYVTKSRWDKKDNHQDNYHDKNNRNNKDQVEKKELSHTADDYVIKSPRNKKDNRQDKNYRDKNNRNKKDELEEREDVSHTTDDYVTKSRRDKKDNHRDKNYDKDNKNKKDQREKREVSRRTDDYVTKSRWDKRDKHQDNNCHDKGRDTAQKGLKIDIFAIKREVEENIRKARMVKNSPAQISDYSNVQSNPTATTLLESRKCESNGIQNTITKTVSENQHNFDQQVVSLGQLHLNTVPKEEKVPHKNSPFISNYQNPNFLLPGSKKKPLDTLNRMVLKKHLAVKLMAKDGVDFLQTLGEKTTLKITVEKQMIKRDIRYACIFAGPANHRKLEAQEAVERFLHPIGTRNVIKTLPFKSDCNVTSLRENLRIIDNSDKFWTHLAGLRYHIVLRKEGLLKTSTNVQNQFDLVKEVQRNYSVLNAMILGKLDVADGPKHMQILRQWLQQINVNSTMTSTIGFSFNYVFNYDSALEIDYPEVIQRFSNDGKLEEKLEIRTMLRIGTDVCNGRGWMDRLKHHKSLYDAVIISNYSADSIEQFKKNYSQLKENPGKVTFKPNTIYETSSKEESLKANRQLQIVNSYAVKQQPPQGHNFPYVGKYNTTPYCTNNSDDFSADTDCSNFMISNSQINLGVVETYSGKNVPQEINQLAKAGGKSKQEDDPHATETQHLDCAADQAVEVQPGLRPYLGGMRKTRRRRNKRRNQRVALMNTPLQHQSPPANLLPFPHAQGIEPMQPPHGVNLASVAPPCNIIPLSIMIPPVKNLDSFILMPATAYKLFEAAGDDFLRTLCEQTNLKIDLIKDEGVSTVQYICTLQGPDEEKPKAKAAIIKFCNSRDDVGS